MKYSYNYNSNMPGALGALGIIYFAIIIAVVVLMVASMWKIFSKAGESGWKSLIPIYNTYILFKISFGRAKEFVIFLISSIAYFISVCVTMVSSMTAVLYSIAEQVNYSAVANRYRPSSTVLGIAGLVCLISAIVMFVFAIKGYIALSKAFGHEGVYALGIIFLPVIFFPMLAFGKSEYIGPVANKKCERDEKSSIEKEIDSFDL